MSSENIAVRVRNLSKCYQIYDVPGDRLKQFITPRLRRLMGKAPKQYFREFWALKDVSFEIGRGESVGIIGRNGSGKSTLLQIICGTLHPTEGIIEINGRVAALLELGSGFNPEFTGRENVYLNASVLGLSNKQIEQRFAAIEDFADIGEFIEQPVKTYSSGMLVRLAFAVIAHVDADILVIDEALAVGDAFFTQKCMRFLRNFMETKTVLFVSHDTAAVQGLCGEAIWLDRGVVRAHGTPKDVCAHYLEAFYDDTHGSIGSVQRERPSVEYLPAKVHKDQREALINSSNLRNDLEIFEFDPAAASFGLGGASLISAEFLDVDGVQLHWMVGGEAVSLQITVHCHERIMAPIVGFFIKDRLGQSIFGDNTYLTYRENPPICHAGSTLVARFSFQMPRLPAGDYAITLSIAEGTQDEHVQHHWMHDALQFKSQSSSVSSGLVGIPMQSIELVAATPEQREQV